MSIELIPSEDLIMELMNRFDHAVFAGMKVDATPDKKSFTARKWKGNSATCSGMAFQIACRIHNVSEEEDENTDEMP